MAQRRLAAILFSDIVDYNALLKRDEKKAFEARKNSQRIHKRLLKKFHGRWLKEMESGILASFQSNIDAVMCAISIQKAAEDAGISIRIGIHQGDVIFESRDVLGNGVNVAARIQSVANTHGITISETVYNDVKNKEGLEFITTGEQTLKGVKKPVEVYKVHWNTDYPFDFSIDTGELTRPLQFKKTPLVAGIFLIAIIFYTVYFFVLRQDNEQSEPDKSVLVLPFDNFIGTDTLDFLVAGMHDALIGNIGKISALRVKSTTTSRAYKNVEKTIPEIASELGVNVVVEGSVLCVGDSICLRVQMVDPANGEQLWVEDYYEERGQILNLYNRITKEITDEINIGLKPEEEQQLAESRTVDPDAYDAYIQGKLYLDRINPQSLQLAKEYFNKAIAIDPDWGPPYGGLAEVAAYEMQIFAVEPSNAVLRIYPNLSKALELDPNSANSHYLKAVIGVWTEFDWEKGEREFKKALELNPSDALCRVFYSHLLMILRRKEEALYHGQQAIKLDPRRPLVLGLYGTVLNFTGEYEAGLELAQGALAVEPNHLFAMSTLANAYEGMGNYQGWFEIMNPRFFWNSDSVMKRNEKIFEEEGFLGVINERIRVNLEVLKNGGRISYHGQAQRYLRVGDYEKAMDCFEKAFEIRDPNVPYVSAVLFRFPELKDNKRYVDFLRKLDLPLP